MVGHVALDHGIGVRIPASQPTFAAAFVLAGTRRALSKKTCLPPDRALEPRPEAALTVAGDPNRVSGGRTSGV